MNFNCGKIFLQKLYVNSESELQIKLASPRFVLANEIAHLQLELGYDHKQAAKALKMPLEELLKLEDVDLNINMQKYYQTLHKLQKLVSTHDIILRNFILQYEQDAKHAEKLPPHHYYRTYELFKQHTKMLKQNLALEINTLTGQLDLTSCQIAHILNLTLKEYQALTAGDQAIIAQKYFEVINQLYQLLNKKDYHELSINY